MTSNLIRGLNPYNESVFWVIQNRQRKYLTRLGTLTSLMKHARLFYRPQDYARALPRWRRLLVDDSLAVKPVRVTLVD